MNKYILFIALIIAFMSVSAQEGEIIDQVIGQVGSEIILLSDVENSIKQFAAQQQGKLPPNAECFVLENIMVQKLLINQANLDSIIVTDPEVVSQVDARVERILGMMGNDRDYFVTYYNKTPEEMREEMFDGVKDLILEERMRGEIIANITITPTEVKNFYASIPVDSLPYYNSEVEVSEIVIHPEANIQSKENAKEKLQGLLDRINNGEDFEELAGKFSDDPGSGAQGGNLGWAKRGQFVPEFEAAAYKLDKEEISPIIETQFGFHIIQLMERRGNRIRLRHILVKPEIEQKDHDKIIRELDSIRNLIVSDSMNFDEAVLKFSNEDVQSYNNGGRILNPQSGDTYFPLDELDSDIYFSIDTMEVGDLSPPLEYLTPTREVGYRIVKLVSKSAPHQASLGQDYAKIQELAKNNKKSEFLINWLETKVEDTYISLDESIYPACENLQLWIKNEKE